MRLAATALCLLAGCEFHANDRRAAPAPDQKPRLEATIALPPCASTTCVHVVVVPTGYLEATRCVVAVGPAGATSTSCTPKDVDLPPEESP